MSDKPFNVPADQSVDYQYYVVDPGFENDTWIVGGEVRPGNRSVVHHCIVFIRPPDSANFRGIGWLGGYVPGQRAAHFPEGHAPANSGRFKSLFFKCTTLPRGTPQQDLTEVGLFDWE